MARMDLLPKRSPVLTSLATIQKADHRSLTTLHNFTMLLKVKRTNNARDYVPRRKVHGENSEFQKSHHQNNLDEIIKYRISSDVV